MTNNNGIEHTSQKEKPSCLWQFVIPKPFMQYTGCAQKKYLCLLLLAGSKPARIQHSLCLCEFQELLHISRTWIYKHLRVTNLSICQQHLWLRLLVIRSQLCLLLSCCMCSAAAATPCHANRFIPFTVSMAEKKCNPHRKQTLKKGAKSSSIWIPKSLKPLGHMDLQ